MVREPSCASIAKGLVCEAPGARPLKPRNIEPRAATVGSGLPNNRNDCVYVKQNIFRKTIFLSSCNDIIIILGMDYFLFGLIRHMPDLGRFW